MADSPFCPEHKSLADKVDEIHVDVKAILLAISRGDTTFATIVLRLKILELVVYGGVGLVLLTVAGIVLARTIGGGP